MTDSTNPADLVGLEPDDRLLSEDLDKLPAGEVKEVVDLCYQCKLCYNHCPYTPPHRWQVDFPRLMLRARAAEARRRGVRLQDRVLGATDVIGRLGSLTAPLSNWAGALAVHRAFVQAVMGIHRDRTLPKFHRATFGTWFARHRRAAGPAGRPSGPDFEVPAGDQLLGGG